ncbi:uncharacterized protein LOC126594971 [Malus sylvestris]|uniref:uncharacterized protein LOC126594971 n=1 Tax=Malus sylvestris TaxID=3752 RepID=UPI0021AD3553|nr:uncharacterized protein LOC126594971 [Malus sylvestris]
MSSWKLIEDVTLCECWVHTTHDPITGNEMDKREMWSKITKAFCDVHGENARTSQGLQGRWKKLNASFTCWKNAISHASGNLRSGTSLADQTLQAQAFYNSKNGNKSFTRWKCWQIVKDCPKYKIVATGPEVVMHGMGLHSSPEPDMAKQEADTFQDTEGMPEQVPETQPTRQSLRPVGKKASKKKGSSSKNDYTKYMEELTRQGELNMAREKVRDEEKVAAMAAILAATEARDAAAERQREVVNRENELVREALHRENELLREERMAQADRDTMSKSLVGLSPNSKYFWTSEKRDVMRRRRARDAETSQGGSSNFCDNQDPRTTYPSSRDFV